MNQNCRGSALVFVLVLAAVMGVFVYIAMAAASAHSSNAATIRTEREALLIEDSIRAAAVAAVTEAVSEGNIATAVAKMSAQDFDSLLDDAQWDGIPFATLSGLPADLFTKTSSGARAVATVAAGEVTSIAVTSPGLGYSVPPSVLIYGGGGSGAMATASVVGGVIASITVTAPGSGYVSAPAVVISSGTGSAPLFLPHSSGYGHVARVREGNFTLTSGLQRLGATPITRSATRQLMWAEIPSVEFQLIATEFAYVSTGSSPVTVSGYALFNRGLDNTTPTLTATSATVGGNFIGDTSTVNVLRAGNHVATWGVGDTRNLVSTDPSGYNALQSYALMPTRARLGRSLTFFDPATLPAGSPTGFSVETFNGRQRLVIDLDTYYEDFAVHIDCTTDDSRAAGIVVRGTSNAALAALSISTNGRITLAGSNERHVVLATNYDPVPAVDPSPIVHILSPAYTGGSVGLATSTTWSGFCVIPVGDLVLSAPEDWSAATFTLAGGLLFKGGTLRLTDNSGANRPITIREDDGIRQSFESGDILSDRLFVLFQ